MPRHQEVPPYHSGAGEVPVAQLRMLSLGLALLLQGVEENAEQLEQQAEQVAVELDGATKSLESLRKAGHTHKQSVSQPQSCDHTTSPCHSTDLHAPLSSLHHGLLRSAAPGNHCDRVVHH
ncbi:hypothetical protein PFLUV_G00198810 [Perca fluviatilis]|uniref:t-SNARE coiled-coil homology domain-containing protein n=1 Tax=Perca fluviatilis TaxID=8168 RepID=A0A6A5DTF5_PERFL|nr:hypothetical protein PFLUV_G00198810 [Perca fluviatilis]